MTTHSSTPDAQIQSKGTENQHDNLTQQEVNWSDLQQQLCADAQRQSQPSTTSHEQEKPLSGMFRVRSAMDVLAQAALQPDPIELYPNLIVQQELTILFADTGIGKTIKAVQIATQIAATKVVLFVDLELSDKQFEKRYRDDNGQHFKFPANFYRADFTPRFEVKPGLTYEEYFIKSLELAIDETGAEVVVIDNMTKLSAGDTDTAKATIPVMESLSRLKFDRGLTFLILEHNKKVDSSRPISLNDLQGSKMKSNFADAVFSIGRSQIDKNLRYIKQLKVRSGELIFDTDNVAVYEIQHENGFLQFVPRDYGSEFEHIRIPTDEEKGDRKANALALKNEGKSMRQIARLIGVSEGAIRKWFKE